MNEKKKELQQASALFGTTGRISAQVSLTKMRLQAEREIREKRQREHEQENEHGKEGKYEN